MCLWKRRASQSKINSRDKIFCTGHEHEYHKWLRDKEKHERSRRKKTNKRRGNRHNDSSN